MSGLGFLLGVLIAAAAVAPPGGAPTQQAGGAREAGPVRSVEISPAAVDAEVGQKVKFSAVCKDASGKQIRHKTIVWFAAPFDQGTVDESGTVTVYNPGEVLVGAMADGQVGYATIKVRPAAVTSLEVSELAGPLVAGGIAQLGATAWTQDGMPRADAAIAWTSDDPSVATVDSAGFVSGVEPGKTRVRARSGQGADSAEIEVVDNPVRELIIEPRSTKARTGDVVIFGARGTAAGGGEVRDLAVRWAVSGEGAAIHADGGFVAERPGRYLITATSGRVSAVGSVVVEPRNAERRVEVVGHAPLKGFQAAEVWLIGKYAYLSSISDKVLVFDISDPSKPKQLDVLTVDARTVNDVSTTSDGRTAVITREGASNRKNGIVFLDTSDPTNLRVVSEYTATVTGGVHSAFIDGRYVYLTDDATGSLRVIDFSDLKNPKEVARWQTENPIAQPARLITGDDVMGGRYLHDVQVKDGLAYLAYWRDGLVILDVGNGVKGGSPAAPKFVSQLRFNYHELYGDGWLAGAHSVFRYKDYLFLGDEVFPVEFDIQLTRRIPVRGIVHVLDVSDIANPRKVAEYSVPEAGAHNMWVEDDVLYMGYYSGGGRILDVSGELRGELYRQGREIARIWTGEPEGFRPNLPFTWGAQPHGGLVYFNDINTGLWIVRLGKPVYKGSTTSPAE